MSLTEVPAERRILETAFAFRVSRILLTAVELGVFTELGKGPRTCGQLCRALGLEETAAPDLLDALVALGFLERDGMDARAIYLNTRAGARCLDANAPASLENVLQQAARAYGTWGRLTELLRAGRPSPAQRL